MAHWPVGLGVFAAGLAITFVRYLRAYLFKPLMDDVLVPASSEQVSFALVRPVLVELGVLLGLTLVVLPIAVFVRSYGAQWIVARVRQDIDRAVAARFLAAPLRLHRAGSSGDFMARALTDAQLACNAVSVAYNEVLINVQMVVGGAIALFLSSWQLATLSLIAMPPFFLVLSFFGRRIERQSHRRQETQGDLSQRLLAILSGIKVIKAFQGQALEAEAFAVETGKYFRRHMKVIWNGVLAKATGELMNPTIGFLVIGFGVWLLLQDMWGMTIGTLTEFSMILVTVYKPIKALTQSFPRMVESAGGARRLFAVLDLAGEPPDRPGARPMRGLEREIRLRDVSYAYEPAYEPADEPANEQADEAAPRDAFERAATQAGDGPDETRDRRWVLRGIDLHVARGEVVAIVGRTGTGKSTLVDLVLRFDDPTRGGIEIDGVDLRDLERASFLDHVAVVTQEPFLFDASIAENIRYGRRDASDEEIRAAARAASADEFIQQLPDGYDTPVGEFGLRLSGGQRQRLTIARAILADPDILVFDEATSALDAQTERAVQHAIESLRGERTIFLVAHRLSTIRHADRIVVLDEGRIVQEGDHEALMREPGLYRELIGIQASGEDPIKATRAN